MLKRIPRRNHTTPVLRELHWLSIHDRIIFKILLLTHKAVNNTAPECICDLITLNVNSTTIRLVDLLYMLHYHCGMPLI